MVATKVQLVPANKKRVSRGKNKKLKVCIHDTGNTSRGAHAQAHANLQSNGNSRAASWHWQVDDKEAIQSYRHNDRCWHSGTSTGNTEAIAIEVCVNSDGDYAKALTNAAELAAKILKNEGLSVSDLTTHNGYSGANCPRQLRNERDGISWDDFVGMVREAFGESKPSKPSSSSSSSGASSTPKKTAQQVAQDIANGRGGWGNDPERSRKLTAAGYNASDVQRRVNALLTGSSSSSNRKSAQQVAQDIANGLGGWGNDPERSRKLRAAGYDSADVQRRVNQLLSGSSGGGSSSSSNRKSAQQVANDIANGRGNWGNDPVRTQRLRAAGYDASDVQRRVNNILSGKSGGNVNVRLSVDQVARQIINGQGNWGNDPERSRKLRNAGYDPAAVQRRVNQLL